MKRLLVGIVLLLCAVAAGAQNTQITANSIAYFGGATVSGSFCLTPTDASSNPINLVTATGQQISPAVPLCFPIASGVLSNAAIVPDVAQVQPVNACYKLAINNIYGAPIAVYPCIQPTGSTWSFDAYVPTSLPSIPALTMPQFYTNSVLNGNQATLNLIPGANVTMAYASPGQVTISASTGGSSNENLSFSATPTFSSATYSSRIALSGNITTFTLSGGSDGQNKCLMFAHDGTSTTYSVVPPANVLGFFTVGSTASQHSQQCFTYFTTDSKWVASNPGVIND